MSDAEVHASASHCRCGGVCNVCSTARARERATVHQPAPVTRISSPAAGTPVQDLVVIDVLARKQVGIERYGTALHPFNGRDARVDAYQEGLDLVMYLRQKLDEEDAVLSALRDLVTDCEEQGMQVQQYREVLDAAMASRDPSGGRPAEPGK